MNKQRQWDLRESEVRFEIADVVADTAVSRVSAARTGRRLAMHDAGHSAADIDAALASHVAERQSVTDMFAAWPFSTEGTSLDWGSPEYREMIKQVGPILRSVVWELWHDYDGEWPTWQEVTDRLITWTGIDFESASRVVCAVSTIGVDGLTAAAPIHDGKRHTAHLGTWRWYIDGEDEAHFQECLYQWRIALGDGGNSKRSVLSLFAAEHPKFWMSPA